MLSVALVRGATGRCDAIKKPVSGSPMRAKLLTEKSAYSFEPLVGTAETAWALLMRAALPLRARR